MKTILLVDDGQDDVFLMKRAFAKTALPYVLHAVKDGQEAIDYLSGIGPYADRDVYPLPALIFLDIKMPRLDGHEVLHWIRAQAGYHTLPIVMLTSSAHPTDMQSAYRLGANSYLIKPADPRNLEDLLRLATKYWLETNTTILEPQVLGQSASSGSSSA
jgi:CheY-like chemotaxis protein